MSEITKTVLPQISAGNAMQGSASRTREASAAADGAGDAFSRVLDQQMSNRREAARSEESARARSAEGEAPREQAAARSEAAQPASAQKKEQERPAKDVDTQDGRDSDGKIVANDAGTQAQAAAGIAALLPGLAGGGAGAASATSQAAGVAASGTVDTQAGADAQAALLLTTDDNGRAARAGTAGAEPQVAVTEDASSEVKPFNIAAETMQAEGGDGGEGDAVSGKAPGVARTESDAELPVTTTAPVKESVKPSLAVSDAQVSAANTGGSDGTAAQMSMQAGGATRSQAATQTQPMPAYIATPAGQPGWAEDVGNRVVLLAGRDESAAELILTPPHLGRVEISIRVSGEHTTAHFVAATPAARDALDQAMPRLREVLAEAGIALGDANVNTQAQQQRGEGGNGGNGGHYRSRYGNEIAGESPVAVSNTWLRRSDGMIDTFA